ncbi:MAG: hypothetical protein AB9835_07620 [Eubacteriales bacterium]
MKYHVWPKFPLGTVACVLSTGFTVLLVLRYGMDIPLPKCAIGFTGAAGMGAGVMSYIKYDRSAGVMYSLLVGLAGIFWAIVELYFPC